MINFGSFQKINFESFQEIGIKINRKCCFCGIERKNDNRVWYAVEYLHKNDKSIGYHNNLSQKEWETHEFHCILCPECYECYPNIGLMKLRLFILNVPIL